MPNSLVDTVLIDKINNQASTKHAIILILAAIMPPMAIASLIPVLPLLMKEFAYEQGSAFLVPIALTVPALCVALFSPLAGWISDKLGRKPVLISALLAYGVVGVVPYFLTDLHHIILVRVLLGVAEAAIMTVATALIADYFTGKLRQKWISIQIASVSLSAIVLIAMGGLLGEFFGSRGPFLLYLVAIPIALAAYVILFEPQRGQEQASKSRPKVPWKRVTPLLLTTLFVGVIFYTIIVKIGVILGLVSEVSPATIGGIGAVGNIGVALGSMAFGKFKGASGPKLMSIGLALSAIGYCGAALSSTLIFTTAALIVACLGFGMLLPTMLNWILSVLPKSVIGRGTGLWTGAFFFGQFTAPIIATALQNQIGGLENVLLIYAVLSLIGVFIAFMKLKGAKSLVNH
ncbi:major facilitator superfamily MFS_1 [Paraglaciecola sp. T6c]|uniref:MFS transporter n=1 Tax=Pseudoalteromonas atlantica (strain T6c / ATCC BAA-1087) TaxID=3042615 RepID=UPI00005C52AD|nr:MFS transporter [Paraglaciecola sp. T6c]ABG39402.1 major facilitator superfamily MFS_1 [Paraglaciecola sp. T6c]